MSHIQHVGCKLVNLCPKLLCMLVIITHQLLNASKKLGIELTYLLEVFSTLKLKIPDGNI